MDFKIIVRVENLDKLEIFYAEFNPNTSIVINFCLVEKLFYLLV